MRSYDLSSSGGAVRWKEIEVGPGQFIVGTGLGGIDEHDLVVVLVKFVLSISDLTTSNKIFKDTRFG